MFEHYYAVIMAGGGGTRLWPLSRKERPKQMLRLFDEHSLFQTSVERLSEIFSPDRILVVTIQEQAKKLRAQTPGIPLENFLLEPMPRGTASVVGLAATALHQRDPEAVMAILTSDHYIADLELFNKLLVRAHEVALDGNLITLGIEPTYPATGFGYIQRGELLGSKLGLDAFQVSRFIEKPDEAAAEKMLASGDYSWNSGMFIWRVDRILSEIEHQMPQLAAALTSIGNEWDTPSRQRAIENVWPGINPQTIDYGIMEKASRVAVIPAAGLGWSDVGSWDSLFEVLEGDNKGNIVIGGKHIGLDTQRSLVYIDGKERLIVTMGVEDIVIVDTSDILLVCNKDHAQNVRHVVDQLRDHGEKYL